MPERIAVIASVRKYGDTAIPEEVVPVVSRGTGLLRDALSVGRGPLLDLCKVRLLDLLWLPDYMGNRTLYIRRVASKHVDFVLCHPQNVAPALVIELDDASYRLPERQERDIFLNEVLRVAEISLLRVPVRKSFSAPALRGQILDTLGVRSQPETAA